MQFKNICTKIMKGGNGMENVSHRLHTILMTQVINRKWGWVSFRLCPIGNWGLRRIWRRHSSVGRINWTFAKLQFIVMLNASPAYATVRWKWKIYRNYGDIVFTGNVWCCCIKRRWPVKIKKGFNFSLRIEKKRKCIQVVQGKRDYRATY